MFGSAVNFLGQSYILIPLQRKRWTCVSTLFVLVCTSFISTMSVVLTMIDLQTRYFGLYSLTYVNVPNTHQSIADLSIRIAAICMFKTLNSCWLN